MLDALAKGLLGSKQGCDGGPHFVFTGSLRSRSPRPEHMIMNAMVKIKKSINASGLEPR